MKYFKFAQISQETGVSWAIEQPISGPSFPEIPWLDNPVQLLHNPIYYIARVDDTAVSNPSNHIFEITLEEYAEELKDIIMDALNREKDGIYIQEYEFRKQIFSKYHETATLAGIYKYEQAKELILDNNALAPEVRAEATARNISALTLAQRIKDNHKLFREKEAKIAGIRGMILDRLESYEFNSLTPYESYADFFATETIGTQTYIDFNGDEKQRDVTVGKYSLSIHFRYECQ